MPTIFDVIKQRYKNWKDERFLRKHNCDNWEQYHRQYDADVCHRSINIKNFYHGYSFFHCIEQDNHYAYQMLYDYGPGGYRYGYHDIVDWCKEYCAGKHRVDIRRVMKNQWSGEWEINELGGGDHVFFAFKDSKDYVNFLLRWA